MSVIVGWSLQAMYPTSLGMNRRVGLSDQNDERSQEVTWPDGCPKTLAECDAERLDATLLIRVHPCAECRELCGRAMGKGIPRGSRQEMFR